MSESTLRFISVKLTPVGRVQAFALDAPDAQVPRAGDSIVVQTESGSALGTVVPTIPQLVQRRGLPSDSSNRVVRLATHEDITARLKHQQREKEAYRIALLKIREHGLEMKLARVEQAFDVSRLVFYFTADTRVDFRDLVRELASEFRTRIEMRQIGVRDEAKVLGGYGTCGRPLCCTTFLTSFEPISIKMAKQQDLSLNPSKLSGLCGRLKCCLRYELPNSKGKVQAHGGCGGEGGCDNPSGCGTGIRRLRFVQPPMSEPGKPRVAITVGDPAGIGPEIALKAANDPRVRDACDPLIYATPPSDLTFKPGVLSRDAGRAAYDVIVRAVEDAARGAIDAVATAPVNKEAFRLAGLPWSGHTDLLAHLTGAQHVAMMFYSEALRVVLATIHIPLSEVPRALNRASLEATISLTASELPRFGIAAPRIGVAGLNPHAGEHGLFGTEEAETIEPAIAACRARGVNVTGPYPGDTVFVRATRGEFDVVIACYHDQGLIPVKLLAFGEAVNVTLGLPIIRTSVDHGTAFDIAGRGIADPGSLIAAVLLAARLASRAKRGREVPAL